MTDLERCARALSADLKRQFDGTPAPGREWDPESWTATCGEIDCTQLARAVLDTLMTPSEGAGVAAEQVEIDPCYSMTLQGHFVVRRDAEKIFAAIIQHIREGK